MAEIEVGNLVAKISLDDSGINKSMAELNRTMKVVQSEFQAAGAKLGDFSKSTEGLKVKAESLTKQIDIQKQIVAKLAAEHARAAAEKGADARETQNLEIRLNKAQAELFKLQNALKATNDEIARQSSSWAKIGDALKPVGEKLQSVGQTMKDAGKTLSISVTAPITAMGASIIKTGMEFEAAMSKVAAISGATGEDLKAMTEQAKELGATTVFSASQAASGMEFLARAGWSAQEIMAAMPGMLNLAAAGALDLGKAADITSNIMSAFSIEASKAGKVADILAMATSNANTDVQQLGQAMTYLAPTAATMGQSLEQAAAAVMIMSDAGIQGEKAGAAFATSLQRLAKPTKEMENVMRELGITFFDVQGHMKPFTQIISEMEVALAGYTDEQKAAALSTLFGAEAYKNWAVLIETGSEALARNVEMLQNADGAAQKMAQTMTDNAKGTWVEFTSAVEGLSIALSDHLLPIFSQIVEKLTEWVRWFGELDPAMQKMTLAFAGIAAAVGPTLVIFGTLIQSVGSIASVFVKASLAIAEAGGLMSVLTGPVGIAVAALAGLVAAGIAVYTNWDTIKKYAIQVWDSIKDYVVPVVNEITGFIRETFEKLAEWWRQVWPDLKQAFENIWNAILAVAKPIIEAIVALMQWAWPFIKTIILETWENIKNAISAALNIIMSLVNIFAATFTGNWTMLWNNVKALAENVWTLLWSLFELWLGKVLGIIGKFAGDFLAIFKKLGDEVLLTLKGLLEKVWNWTSEFAKPFLDLAVKAIQWGKNIVEGFWNGIESLSKWVREKVTGFVESIGATIRAYFGIASPSTLMVEYGGYVAEGLAVGINAKAPAAIQAAQSMANGVKSVLEETIKFIDGVWMKKVGNVSVEIGRSTGSGWSSAGWNYGADHADSPSWLFNKGGSSGGSSSSNNKKTNESKYVDDEGAYYIPPDDKLRKYPGLATGGTVVKAGWTLVGEKGPELLHLPRGSQVIPNYELPRLGAAAIDYDALARALARHIKPSITQYNTFTSPQPLTPSETARRNQQVLRQMALEWGLR